MASSDIEKKSWLQRREKKKKWKSRSMSVMKILEFFGRRNSSQQSAKKNNSVWIFDNTAYMNEQGTWEAEFTVVIFNQKAAVGVTSAVADFAIGIGLGSGNETKAVMQKRLIPCVRSVVPGRIVKIDFGSQKQIKMSPGSLDCISSDIKSLPEFKSGTIITSKVRALPESEGLLEMKTLYAGPEGWGVISDIDDTIKLTQTSDPMGFLHETFVAEPSPIKGMPELFSYIQILISYPPFFYLSASPYNLYPFLHTFRQNYFPYGTIALRNISWIDPSFLLSNFTLGIQTFKIDYMKKIHSWLPNRKMICIGDSTQSDPEVYAELYRMHPGWIRLILIRKVTDISSTSIGSRNETTRFSKAFKGIPKEDWFVFESPNECYSILRNTSL
ncbi:BgTH12-04437 [Blumeria graminis f. sp. triticale]|uniref:BgTH12-04437 n=1 Tax=Blumeria graminis f. sp. triticale TaxID=1689686 RepID=A0A9W4CUT8_BLUGR|nr:BgTH12-04437 [Blumeria graminis f. sp. triticale]